MEKALIGETERSAASTSGLTLLTRLLTGLRIVLLALLPTYVSNRLRPRSASEEQRPARVFPTSYLDGIRGLCAVLVFVHHVVIPWRKGASMGYGTISHHHVNDNYNVFKLPILKVLHSGPFVPVFYVASGFGMSYGPLKLIRKTNYEALGKALTSSVFRRPLRLFLPPLVLTFLTALAAYHGWYNFRYESLPGHKSKHPEQFDTLYLQLADWFRFVKEDLTNGFTWKKPVGEYNSNLWTIPAQFRCSMITLLVLAGLAPMKPFVRTAALVAMWAYALRMGRWEVASYLAGIFISERKLASLERESEESEAMLPMATGEGLRQTFRLSRKWRVVLWRLVFIAGLYCGSFPRVDKDVARKTPGFAWMVPLTGSWDYWHSFSATLIIWAVGNDPLLQRFFTLAPIRYVADLSFSIYLVHGPLLHWFGWALVPTCLSFTGKSTSMQYSGGLTLAVALLLPIVLWVADVFNRFVEKPCGVFAGKIEALLLKN
ncbi:acyltransferase family protein [Sarocladium implicatum]|nr:acyltransferase family protein [Sarocladium implicatum]